MSTEESPTNGPVERLVTFPQRIFLEMRRVGRGLDLTDEEVVATALKLLAQSFDTRVGGREVVAVVSRSDLEEGKMLDPRNPRQVRVFEPRPFVRKFGPIRTIVPA